MSKRSKKVGKASITELKDLYQEILLVTHEKNPYETIQRAQELRKIIKPLIKYSKIPYDKFCQRLHIALPTFNKRLRTARLWSDSDLITILKMTEKFWKVEQ